MNIKKSCIHSLIKNGEDFCGLIKNRKCRFIIWINKIYRPDFGSFCDLYSPKKIDIGDNKMDDISPCQVWVDKKWTIPEWMKYYKDDIFTNYYKIEDIMNNKEHNLYMIVNAQIGLLERLRKNGDLKIE